MNHLTNHLWQSTGFRGGCRANRNGPAAQLCTGCATGSGLRLNQVLIPFSVLVSLGGGVARPTAAPALSALTVVRVSTYFAPAPTFATVTRAVAPSYWHSRISAVLAVERFSCYSVGTAVGARYAMRLEPAKLSWWHPSLPALVSRSRSSPEFSSVPSHPSAARKEFRKLEAGTIPRGCRHELCHVRYRDNLTAALHMCVETLFWFHPIVCGSGESLVRNANGPATRAYEPGKSPGRLCARNRNVLQNVSRVAASVYLGHCGRQSQEASSPNHDLARYASLTFARKSMAGKVQPSCR